MLSSKSYVAQGEWTLRSGSVEGNSNGIWGISYDSDALNS